MLFLTEGVLCITTYNGGRAHFPRILDLILSLLQSIGFPLFNPKDVSFSFPSP